MTTLFSFRTPLLVICCVEEWWQRIKFVFNQHFNPPQGPSRSARVVTKDSFSCTTKELPS